MPNLTSQIESCPVCGSKNLEESLEPPSSTHFARLSCGDCGAWVKWLPKPPKHQAVVDNALVSNRVSGWENLFLRSVRTRKHLTPKQEEKLNQILVRHGFDTVSNDTG